MAEGSVRSHADQSGTLVKLQIITSRYALLMITVGARKICLPRAKRRNCHALPRLWQTRKTQFILQIFRRASALLQDDRRDKKNMSS